MTDRVYSVETNKFTEPAPVTPPYMYDVGKERFRYVTQEDVRQWSLLTQAYGKLITAHKEQIKWHEQLMHKIRNPPQE